jgi:hypothetical protein
MLKEIVITVSINLPALMQGLHRFLIWREDAPKLQAF